MWKWNDLKRLILKRQDLDTRNLGAIMWPVAYPNLLDPSGGTYYQPKDPHITVIYFGEIDGDIGYTKEDVIDAIESTMWEAYLWCRVTGVEWFGPEQDVPVLRVEHDYLPVFWESIKGALRQRGIPFDETYPEYKPHVTIPTLAALEGVYPNHLLAGPVELWWGNEHIQIGGGQSE